MAVNVKIATVGQPRLSVPSKTSMSQITRIMMDHWRNVFARVLPDKPDLIVVPEACDCPPELSPEQQLDYYAYREEKVLKLFAATARDHHCYIVYSSVRRSEEGHYFNSSIMLDRQGHVAGIYDKNYCTIYEMTGFDYDSSVIFDSHDKVVGMYDRNDRPVYDMTTKNIRCGHLPKLIECDFGRVGCVICFDLNFEELRKHYAKLKPDLLLFSSMYHGGDVLQSIWAYDCRCHFVGAIPGLPAQIRNPFGEVMASSSNYRPFTVSTVNLDNCMVHYDHNWKKIDALKTEFGTEVEIHDPGLWGAVLITSHSENYSAVQMARHVKMELIDEYLHRSKMSISKNLKL